MQSHVRTYIIYTRTCSHTQRGLVSLFVVLAFFGFRLIYRGAEIHFPNDILFLCLAAAFDLRKAGRSRRQLQSNYVGLFGDCLYSITADSMDMGTVWKCAQS